MKNHAPLATRVRATIGVVVFLLAVLVALGAKIDAQTTGGTLGGLRPITVTPTATPTPNLVRACFQNVLGGAVQGSLLIPCQSAPTAAPTSGATPRSIPTPVGGGAWSTTFSVGDSVANRYEVAIQFPASGSTMQIAGYTRNQRTNTEIPILLSSVTPATLTLPSLPVSSLTYFGIEVNPATGDAAIVTATRAKGLSPTTGAWHIVWYAAIPVGRSTYTALPGTVGSP